MSELNEIKDLAELMNRVEEFGLIQTIARAYVLGREDEEEERAESTGAAYRLVTESGYVNDKHYKTLGRARNAKAQDRYTKWQVQEIRGEWVDVD